GWPPVTEKGANPFSRDRCDDPRSRVHPPDTVALVIGNVDVSSAVRRHGVRGNNRGRRRYPVAVKTAPTGPCHGADASRHRIDPTNAAVGRIGNEEVVASVDAEAVRVAQPSRGRWPAVTKKGASS